MSENKFILFDGIERQSLLPFTFTRAIADIRIGILRIREKWDIALKSECGILSQTYLQGLYSFNGSTPAIYINAAILPNKEIVDSITLLKAGEALFTKEGSLIALAPDATILEVRALLSLQESLSKKTFQHHCSSLKYPWDIFKYNASEIQNDIRALQLEPNGHLLEEDNKISHPENIYVEEGAIAQWAMLNAEKGPIYLGKDSHVMEGAIIKENTALCEHSTIKMAAKIYGDSTIGPHSKVGGEVSNSVIFGYSNKGHDGFLGNSVLGEWCNLGADTNNSNLKNNYSAVKSWSYLDKKQVNTGLQFCGLMMGDHSKCGINTMFNTGTVVGVSANIYGGGFPSKFIPSFSWGGQDGYIDYEFDKAIETAKRVMARRSVSLTDIDIEILRKVYNDTEAFRN